MASTPATNAIGVELQAVGENLNTWGNPKLTNALQILVNMTAKWLAVALVDGTNTVSETNYSTSNSTEVAFVKFTGGTLTAAASWAIPSRSKRILCWNAEAYAITVKLAATTGVSIPASRIVWIATDGSADVYNASPNYVGTTFVTTANGDVANKLYVDTAIATASIPASAGTILIDGSDTTAGYPANKLRAFGTMVASVGTVGGNETLDFKPVSYTASGTNSYTITPAPAYTSLAAGMEITALFTNANNAAVTIAVNGLTAKAITKNGATALVSGDIAAGEIKKVIYDGTQFQMLSPPGTVLGLFNGGVQTSSFGTVVNARYTAEGSAITVTGPSSASTNDVLVIAVGSTAVTFTPNGLKVNGSTGSITLPANNTVTMMYNSTQGWV